LRHGLRIAIDNQTMPMRPLPDLASLSLAEIAQLMEEDRLPPVERWNPAHCGDSGMTITRDGRWLHEGAPITRESMVRLFSTILRREPDGSYVLVTPVEKLSITVEDAPFVASELRAEGEGADSRLIFRLNTGDLVLADAAHPLRFAKGPDGPLPYLQVRGDMEARVARPVYYELVERALAREGQDPVPGVWSAGSFFPLDAA
jgi:hypothetical protein